MRRRERGFALPVVLLLLLLVAAGSALIVIRVRTTQRETSVEAVSVQALWAVEGALESAAHALRQGESPPRTLVIGGQTVEIQVRSNASGWDVEARTTPTIAEIHVSLDARGRQISWQRIR